MTTRTACALLACLALSGCGSSPKPRYYTLQMPSAAGQPADGAQAGVVLGPVNLPEAVDRVQLVLRSGDNTVDISDAHRWAEPLKSQVGRVLAANLARELGTPRVSLFGTATGVEGDIRVAVDIVDLQATLGGDASVEALWTVRGAHDAPPLHGRAVARVALPGSGYEAVAAAYGSALAQIGKEIAATVRRAERP